MKKLILAAALLLAAISTAAPQTSNGRATTAAPTYPNNTTAPLSLDTSGGLRVNCVTGCAASGGTQDVNITEIGGNAVTTTIPVSGTVAATQSGGWTVSATQSGTWTVQPGNTANTTPWLVTVATALPVGANTIGAVTQASGPWTQNITQLGGTAIDVSTGNAGSGTARVAVSTNNPAIATWGHGATASAVPANATLAGARSGANMVALIQASSSVAVSMNTATTTQMVALSGSTLIYVTSFDVIAGGTTNVTFVYGTGSNCGTGTTSLTGAYPLTAQSGIAKGNGLGPVLVVPAGNALCVTNSAAQQISGSISYTQF